MHELIVYVHCSAAHIILGMLLSLLLCGVVHASAPLWPCLAVWCMHELIAWCTAVSTLTAAASKAGWEEGRTVVPATGCRANLLIRRNSSPSANRIALRRWRGAAHSGPWCLRALLN